MNKKLGVIKILMLLIVVMQLLSPSSLVYIVVATNHQKFQEISITNLSSTQFSHTTPAIEQSGISNLSPNTIELTLRNLNALNVNQYNNNITFNASTNFKPAFTHETMNSNSKNLINEPIKPTKLKNITELNSPVKVQKNHSAITPSDFSENALLQRTSLVSNPTITPLFSSHNENMFLQPSIDFNDRIFAEYDIFFTEIPEHIIIPYTGQESTTVELSWTAINVGEGSVVFGTRTYEVALYIPSNFPKGHLPSYPDDYISLSQNELQDATGSTEILDSLFGVTDLIGDNFSPGENTWEQDKRLTLSYTHKYLPYATILMIFQYKYLTTGLSYGFIPTLIPHIKTEYTFTKVHFADDEAPIFFDFPKNGESIFSSNDLNRNCPDLYPSPSQSLRIQYEIVEPFDTASTVSNQSQGMLDNCGIISILNTTANVSIFYEKGAPNPVLSYNVFDNIPEHYELFAQLDEPNTSPSIVRKNTWDSRVPVSYAIDDMYLEKNHTFRANFYDQQGNFASQAVFVGTIDPAPPEFINKPSTLRDVQDARLIGELHPGDAFVQSDIFTILAKNDFLSIDDEYEIIVYEPDVIQNQLLKWNVLEYSPTTYSIYKDGTIIPGYENRSYSDAITPSVFLPEIGELVLNEVYNLTIIVYDLFGYSNSDTIFVVLTDHIRPTITGESVISIVDDPNLEFELKWIAEDFYPDKFTLYFGRNPIPGYINVSWDSGVPIYYTHAENNSDYYLYTIRATDLSGNNAEFFTVVTTIESKLIVIPAANISTELGSTGQHLKWNTFSLRPTVYQIYRNGSIILNSTWASGEPIQIGVNTAEVGIYEYKATFFDAYGNAETSSLFATIRDTISPWVLNVPGKQIFEYGSKNRFFLLYPQDLKPERYYIIVNEGRQDEFLAESGNWENGVAINYLFEDFYLGTYLANVYILDASNNVLFLSIEIEIIDTIKPSFLDLPVFSKTVEYRLEGYQLNYTWKIKEDFPNYYQFLELATTGNFMKRVSSTLKAQLEPEQTTISILINVTDFGVYLFQLDVVDTSNNMGTYFFKIVVGDTTPPELTDSSGYFHQYGITGNTINWTVNEINPEKYTLKLDGLVISVGKYKHNETLVFSSDGYAIGTHEFTLTIFDKAGLSASDSLEITVGDKESPVIIVKPNDYFYEIGSTGNTLLWVANDDFPENYTIYRNNTILNTDSWEQYETIIINIDGLQAGVNSFEIRFYDEFQRWSSHTVFITVDDTIAPVILPVENLQVEFNSTGNFVAWEYIEDNPYNFAITKDGVIQDSGLIQTIEPIMVDLDGLSIRENSYFYTLKLWDKYGNTANHTVQVNVADTTPPEIIYKPSGFSYKLHEAIAFNLNWTATDLNPDSYIIKRNGELLEQTRWISSQTITYQINASTPAGKYAYEISIYDKYGNIATHTVRTQITDELAPLFVFLPDNYEYEYASTGHSLVWTATDIEPARYNITKNGNRVFGGTWDSGINITYIIDGNDVGTHLFEISVSDSSGNLANDTVILKVVDTTKPTHSQHVDLQYEVGRKGNFLNWTVFDHHPDVYRITKDGIEVSSSTWFNVQQHITLQVDDLELGNHIFKLEILDYYGNVGYDRIIVTVLDTRAPELLIYNNVTYEYGTQGNFIDWIGIDWYSDRYELYSNGKLRLSKSWITTAKTQTNVDGLAVGVYNYTIKLYDTTGNQVTKAVIVTVEDKTAPIIQSPDSFTVELGSTVQSHLWNLSDLEPDIYNLTINGVLVESKTWTPEKPVYLNVLNTTIAALYLYQLTVSDKSGNIAQSQVLVSIVDTIPPFIRLLSAIQTQIVLEYGTPNYKANWSVIDISIIGTYSILVNDEIFEQQSSWNSEENITYTLSNLIIGDYNLTLIVADTNQNLASNSILITVRDSIAPALSHNLGQILELGENAKLTWVAYDLAPSYYLIYKNQVMLRNSSWQSGENLTILLDTSTLGSSIYKIAVVDKSGNSQYDFVQIQIADGIAPNIEFETSNLQNSLLSHQVGIANSSITWTANDEHPNNFILLRNNTQIAQGIWENNQEITYNLGSLALGNYLFKIEFFDKSNNNAISIISITLVDRRAPEISMPDDLTLEFVQEQQTNYTIEWSVYDFYPKNYTILLDQNILITGEYSQNDVITIQQPVEAIGQYEYQLIIQDEFNQRSTDRVQVSIEESNPPILLLATNNITVEFGTVSTERMQWEVFDKNPTVLHVYFEGTFFGSTNWISNKTESIGFPNLKVGSYNVTVQFFDIAGASVSTTAWWNVVDTTIPRLSKHPELQLEYGTQKFTTHWQAFDLTPSFYQILYNGRTMLQDYWNNDEVIVFEVPEYLPIGTHNYIIIVYDTSRNQQLDILRIQVADSVNPVIIAESEIVTSSTVEYIEWRISDLQLSDYKLYLNDSMIESGDFTNTRIVMFTRLSDLLFENTYIYTIIVNDKSGNSNTHDVQVTVKDTEEPEFISYPNDQNAFLGQNFGEKQILTFSAYDSLPGLYYVTRGNVQIVDGEEWENFETIEIPVKNLQNFVNDVYNITVVDKLGLKTSFTVEVGLIDTVNPKITIISELQNKLPFEYGEINIINWTAFDRFPASYFLAIKERDSPINPITNPRQLLTEYSKLLETNQVSAYFTKFRETFGTILEIADWFALQNLGVSLNLEVGYYVISLIHYDRSENFEITQISITVQDTIAPVITETHDAQILEFDLLLENRISWKLTDLAPSKYEIWNGEVLLHNATWENHEQRVVLENLTMFTSDVTYNLTVKAYDKHGFTNQKQSFITFQDTLEPRIKRIFNETEFAMTEEQSLGWTLQDQHLSSYSIYIDQELIENERLKPINETVLLSLTGLNFGTYNIRIVVKDSFGNQNFDSVTIFINDEIAPVIYAQKYLSFEYGSTVENNTWYAVDFNPSFYQIMLNDILLKSGSWFMNESIELPLKQLSIGHHQLELVVFDSANNIQRKIIDVQVFEKTVTTTLQQGFYTFINFLFLVLIIILCIVGISLYVEQRRRQKAKNLKAEKRKRLR